ncbi:MAG: nucleotidyltransferase domain-containing protein [Candidatus Aenigmatarchaeota archaeon]
MSINILKHLQVLIPFTEDINSRFHGRGLEKKLDLSQKAIQKKLNTLEKEGILVSETSGRTKQFMLNKESTLTRKALIMAEIIKFYDLVSSNFEAKEIIEEVLNKTSSQFLVYGSFAGGDYDKTSDLDILIIGQGREGLKEIDEKYSRDIHFMFISEVEFKEGMNEDESYVNEVLKNHVICRGFENITSWRFEYA